VKVLVKEKIGESGVQLLRDAGLEVELGVDWDDGELERRIGEFDGILIRSATKLTGDLLEHAFDPLEHFGELGLFRQRRDPEVIAIRCIEARARRDQDVLLLEQLHREALVVEGRQALPIDADERVHRAARRDEQRGDRDEPREHEPVHEGRRAAPRPATKHREREQDRRREDRDLGDARKSRT